MTDANYIRHFSVLGKLCYLYDLATASAPTLQQGLAAYLDQVANDDPAINSLAITLIQQASTINNAIAAGPTSIQSSCITEATRYLQSTAFTGTLTTPPASSTVAAIIAALETDMGAGVDNKTLTVEGSTGLVNFFDVIKGSEGTWNTADPAGSPPETPDYPDSTYVVVGVIAD